METRASHVVVGSFVLALLAGAIGFVLWLAKVDLDSVPERYAVYFTGSVTGLQVGSRVQYRGIPVGTVADIRIDPKDIERIRVLLDIAEGTPIKEDTIASLGIQGITGLAFVQLAGGSQASPALAARRGEDYPVIASRVSGLEQVLAKAPELFEKAVMLGDRLTALVDDNNIRAIAETLESVRTTTKALADRAGSLDGVITEGTRTLKSLRETSDQVGGLVSAVQGDVAEVSGGAKEAMGEIKRALGEVRGTARAFTEVADRLDQLIGENRAPLRDFSATGIYELTQFIAEARLLVAGLTRITGQIERDPARFFFGDAQRGFEAR